MIKRLSESTVGVLTTDINVPTFLARMTDNSHHLSSFGSALFGYKSRTTLMMKPMNHSSVVNVSHPRNDIAMTSDKELVNHRKTTNF